MDDKRAPLNPSPARDRGSGSSPAKPARHPPQPRRHQLMQLAILALDVVCLIWSLYFLIVYGVELSENHSTMSTLDLILYGYVVIVSAVLVLWCIRCTYGVWRRKEWTVRSNKGLFTAFGVAFVIAAIWQLIQQDWDDAIDFGILVIVAAMARCITGSYHKRLRAQPMNVNVVSSAV